MTAKTAKTTKTAALLTDELRKKVEARVREVLALAKKKYKMDFPFPTIRYDIKSWMGGLAYPGRNLIRLNLILLVENEQDYIHHTVAHEVAHLVARKAFPKRIDGKAKRVMPHGPEWKDVMATFNIPADVKHTYDCSSIERIPRNRMKSTSIRAGAVENLLKRIDKLTLDQRQELMDGLREMYS